MSEEASCVSTQSVKAAASAHASDDDKVDCGRGGRPAARARDCYDQNFPTAVESPPPRHGESGNLLGQGARRLDEETYCTTVNGNLGLHHKERSTAQSTRNRGTFFRSSFDDVKRQLIFKNCFHHESLPSDLSIDSFEFPSGWGSKHLATLLLVDELLRYCAVLPTCYANDARLLSAQAESAGVRNTTQLCQPGGLS